MTLAGTRLGAYDIVALIGAGGMGQVYRARDTKLDRDVALKVLPSAFAADPERVARFQREAKTLASLNHPNIAQIYGLEEVTGVTALVLELVEGPTLADRIARGPIPLDEALPIARQIADALEAAHEQGIIHRDLKPANVKVKSDGMVKVLDFGLAKAFAPDGGGTAADLANSPTLSMQATQAGLILGTAAYMSPEQASGKPVDKRSDVWAFAVVLMEMLTGRPVFAGETISHVLAAVLTKEPDWTALSTNTPPPIVRLLRRCLEKDRKRRLADASDARLEIDEAGREPNAVAGSTNAKVGRLAWGVAAGLLLVSLALAVPAMQRFRETPPAAAPEIRTEINTPATDSPASFALSPDGRQIAFVASGDGASRLWLRSLATTTAQPLAGTEGARFPFWAPDSRSVGFFADNALKRLDLGGGAPQTLAPVRGGFGGTWSADGVIVFAPSLITPLMRVPATGGGAVAVTTLGPQQASHGWPHMLPDGRRLLFSVRGGPDPGIYLGALDGRVPIRLTPGDVSGMYLPSGPGRAEAFREGGWLLWVRVGTQTLVAQRLDAEKAALTGDPVTLADGVAVDGNFRSALSVAATGLVAYRTGATSARQLTWVDRSGTARGTVGDPDGNGLSAPRVSSDGRRVVVERTVQRNADIWLLDGARTSRLTFDTAVDLSPVWSPDSTRIVFTSYRTGVADLYQTLASGGSVEERLVTSDQTKIPTSWSADGRFLLYFSIDPKTNTDLWVVPMVGERTPSLFLKTPFYEVHGVFSPDGRWVAYQSDQSGRNEIHVRPFAPPGAAGTASGGQWQVSTSGGVYPAWRPDGKELYYLNPAGGMMAAPITVTGATLAPGAPMLLFPTKIYGGGVEQQQRRQYDVAPDGRFLINTVLDSAAAPITLLQNWRPPTSK